MKLTKIGRIAELLLRVFRDTAGKRGRYKTQGEEQNLKKHHRVIS